MMNILSKVKSETQAAMSHMLLRGLCMLIIEYDCARLIQQATGQPMIRGNVVLASLYALGFLVSFVNRKVGFIIGMVAGSINVIIKIIIVVTGHEHYPYYPIVWITQSLIVIYFCYKALKAEKVLVYAEK
jgi:hypothetical protein